MNGGADGLSLECGHPKGCYGEIYRHPSGDRISGCRWCWEKLEYSKRLEKLEGVRNAAVHIRDRGLITIAVFRSHDDDVAVAEFRKALKAAEVER